MWNSFELKNLFDEIFCFNLLKIINSSKTTNIFNHDFKFILLLITKVIQLKIIYSHV